LERTAAAATEGKPADRDADGGASPLPRRRGRPRGAQTRLLSAGAGELGRHHFAFLRALVDGIDLEHAWKRYLAFSGGPSDRRHFASRLRQLVDVIDHAGPQRGRASEAGLVVAALRALPDFVPARARPGAGKAGRLGAAAVESAAIPDRAPSPTLEDWRSQYCGRTGIDEDFYTEAEWLELYAEEFGEPVGEPFTGAGKAGHIAAAPSPALSATTHARRADVVEADPARLTTAQRKGVLEALAALEQVLAREPSLEDETGFWLGAGMPRDLAKVGVKSLGDLINFVNIYGFRWHRRVARMGVVRAHRLLDWLTPVAEARGRPLKEAARRPETDLALLRRRELAGAQGGERFALVPIFDGTLPDALSGRVGAFRAQEANVWGAETDVQAISQWLSRYRGQTLRDYTRVAERFYLWCTHVQRKALSSLQEPDLQAYQAFLAAPPADWVQERQVRREDASWRPFRGPLGRNSQRHEFTVLGSMFSTMLEKGYLRANAMANLGRTLGLIKPSIDVRRSFSDRHWAFARQVLHEKPDTPERRRLELLLELGSTTGLRLSELATTRMKGFREEQVDGESAWLLEVVGKGGKLRTVVVLDHVKALIEQHHRDMDAAGLGFDPSVSRVQVPGSLATTAAGERSLRRGNVQTASASDPSGGGLAEALAREALHAWRPLVGILRRPPPRRKLDHLGVAFVDRAASSQADRFGALERSAIYKLLRRFFRDAAVAAASRRDAPDASEFLGASTHWLRHTFANTAVKQMQPQVLQSLLGHSDLRVTSVYVKADATDIVRGIRAMQRAGAEGGIAEPAARRAKSPPR
jgi:site-specific recombinase XerD